MNRMSYSTIIYIMGQTLVKNYVHLIFSTKNRQPLINPPFDVELYKYLGGIANSHECIPVKIGGFRDHVHILCSLSKKVALSHLVEALKSSSSKWIKTKDPSLANFYWQTGYGAFSINPLQVDDVIQYISNQEEHHRKKSFQEEYLVFLKKYNLEYNENYLWD